MPPFNSSLLDLSRVSGAEQMTRPVVQGWLGMKNKAKEARKQFDRVGDICTEFFQGSSDLSNMPEFRNQFMRGEVNQTWEIVIAKAFELVAVVGPVLFWRYPQRAVKPRSQYQLPQQFFGDPQQIQQQMQQLQQSQDPGAQQQMMQLQQQLQQQQQMMQQVMQQRQQRDMERHMRSSLWQDILSYMPREQPHGGLAEHSSAAIREALVTGRGVLWPEAYIPPGSDIVMSACNYDFTGGNRSLLIDPDAKSLSDAWFIMRERWLPHWYMERQWRLPQGSLKQYSTQQTNAMIGYRETEPLGGPSVPRGKAQHMIQHWEVFSKMGVGSRLQEVNSQWSRAFDQVVGDFAYMVIAENVPFPLNAPPNRFNQNTYDDDTRQMFRWPTPFYDDNKWPCAVLDFHPRINNPYPIAPLEPGLGELICINMIASHLANRVWLSGRDFIAVLKSAHKEVKEIIEQGKDLSILPVSTLHDDIRKVIQFVQHPQINLDVWQVLNFFMQMFDKRVGMTDLLYGMNPGGSQLRSATDANNRMQAVSNRPDYMAARVESWQTEAAQMEMLVNHEWNNSQSIGKIFNPEAAIAYKTLVEESPKEATIRELGVTVEAGSVRKPNKQRDTENMGQAMQYLMPLLDKHADMTSDVEPLKWLIGKWAEAADQDMSGVMQMGPRAPAPPPPEQQQQMQQQAQMMQQQAQMQMRQLEIKLQQDMVKLQTAMIKARESMAKAQSTTDQVQIAKAMDEMQMQLDMAQHQQSLIMDMQSHLQDIRQRGQAHVQDLDHDQEKHELDLNIIRQKGKAQVAAMRSQARARQQTQGSGAPNGNGRQPA